MSLLAAEGYCAVQGIRFGADVLERVAEVRAFMRRHDVRIGSWWLCERSTPGDVEAQLSDAGLVQVPGDYEVAGMLLTRSRRSARPAGPPGAILSGGATAEHARGRGSYRALVRARWDDVVARGGGALVVQAASLSEPILRRLGFEHVLQFHRLEDVLPAAYPLRA
jgi:hypothetical protein